MTRVARRFGGLLASIVGLAGMAFAIIAIYETWLTVERLRVVVPNAIDQADAIVQSIQQQGQATSELLVTTRQHLTSLAVPIQELASRNRRLSNADILATLDETILRRMENVEHFSLSMQNSMRSMSNALLIFSLAAFSESGASSPNPNPDRWKELAASLSKSADLLEEASRSVSRIRSGQDVPPQQMDQLAQVLAQIDDHLQRVQVHIEQFSQTVDRTNIALNSVKEIAPAWIQRLPLC